MKNLKFRNSLSVVLALVMMINSLILGACGKETDNGNGTADGKDSAQSSSQTTGGEAPRGIRADIGDVPAGNDQGGHEASATGSGQENSSDAEDKQNAETTTESVQASASGLSSVEFVKGMGYGWNLGNALDAANCDWLSDPMDYEGAWCGVKASPELIETVHNAGFDTIRIPVSWHDHVDANYNIDQKWMDRVVEVVDYAYDRGMYVIIDVHHDIDPDYYYPSRAKEEQTKKYMETVWSQIADRFADYDEKLLFESINEPRLVGTGNEWWFDPNNTDCKDALDVINECNQIFVDTVRSSGGNNPERYLVVASYDDSYEATVYEGFKIPSDSANDKILVAVHMYLPYDFAGNANGTTTFDESAKAANETALNAVNDRFVAKGIGVLIDEYGALNKGNPEQRVLYYDYFAKAAKDRGMCPVAWDNNVFEVSTESSQGLGLIDYGSKTVRETDIVNAIVN